VRPSPDALREQAFAVLAPHLPGAVFLDLFAGTGAVSLEALSRGAARCVAVERAGACVDVIRSNAEALGVEAARLEIRRGDAAAVVRRLGAEGVVCNVAWCDPPFQEWDHGIAALAAARATGVVRTGALAVVELPEKRRAVVAGFREVRSLRGAALLMAE